MVPNFVLILSIFSAHVLTPADAVERVMQNAGQSELNLPQLTHAVENSGTAR